MDPERVLVAGDTHGNVRWITTLCRLARRHGCDVVLQLGDFGLWPERAAGLARRLNERWLTSVSRAAEMHRVRIRFVDGNHDAHPLARASYGADPDTGVRALRPALDWADRGAVWEWGGRRFGALGGAVSVDRHLRTEGSSWWPTEATTVTDLEALVTRAQGGLDVLVTHDAPVLPPAFRAVAGPYDESDCVANRSVLSRAVEMLRPQLLLHGHYHVGYSSEFAGCRIEGFASDGEAANVRLRSWAVLELPDLRITEAGRIV